MYLWLFSRLLILLLCPETHQESSCTLHHTRDNVLKLSIGSSLFLHQLNLGVCMVIGLSKVQNITAVGEATRVSYWFKAIVVLVWPSSCDLHRSRTWREVPAQIQSFVTDRTQAFSLAVAETFDSACLIPVLVHGYNYIYIPSSLNLLLDI